MRGRQRIALIADEKPGALRHDGFALVLDLPRGRQMQQAAPHLFMRGGLGVLRQRGPMQSLNTDQQDRQQDRYEDDRRDDAGHGPRP